jgi:hypothetical protein
LGWAALCVALVCGCEDEAQRAVRTLSATSVQGLEDALLYVGQEGGGEPFALLLDVARREPKASLHALPEGSITTQARSGRSGEALLLSSGAGAELVDGKGRDAVNSFLLVYDRSGEKARYELSGRYMQLAQSEDGRFAIAYAASGDWSTADSIAVVDFEHADRASPVPSTALRALNGEGPSAIAFAPAESKRRLAVLVMTDAINLIDLEQPQLSDKVLPLKLPNGAPPLHATKVLFHGDRCFVQSDNGSDVLVVRLEDDEDSASGFRASLLSLATEAVVRDIALIDPESEARLLALSDANLRVIDTTTGDGETTPTQVAFKQALLFRGRSPFDQELRSRALLVAPNSRQIGFVDLQPELSGRERSVEIVTLSDVVQQTALAESQNLAVITHNTGRVSLVDLEERSVSLVGTAARPRQLLMEENGGAARAWIVTENGVVGVLDLTRRSATPLLLDRPAAALVFVPGPRARVAVTHEAASGRVTLLDAVRPSRSGAREIVGFTFSGFFD